MSFRRLWAAALGAGLLAAGTGQVLAEEPGPPKERIERFLVDHFQLGPRDAVRVERSWTIQEPRAWGLVVTLTHEGQTSTEVYSIARDLSWIALGRVYDFGSDARALNRSRIDLQNAPARGPADAPVTLVVFCEFQCKDCREMNESLERVLPDYEGRVRVVFKNLPLMNKHDWAEAAAIGARCAYEQKANAFWVFHDALYPTQRSINGANLRDSLLALAGEAGLDQPDWARCYDGAEPLAAIQRDVYEARKLGARGTPTILINGRFVFDEEAEDGEYRKLIEEALAAPASR